MENVKLIVRCVKCCNISTFYITQEQLEELKSGTKFIQDIFPELTPAEREMLISRTCGECWNKIFNENDNEVGE